MISKDLFWSAHLGPVGLVIRLCISAAMLGGLVLVIPVRETLDALERMDSLYLLFGVVATVLSLVVKGVRWAWFFPKSLSVRVSRAFQLSMIGLLFNGFLPGRAGELVRIGAGAKCFKADWTLVTITIVLERLFDAMTLMAMLALPLLLLPSLSSMEVVEVFGQRVDGQIFETVSMVLGSVCLAIGLVLAFAAYPRTRVFLLLVFSRLPIGAWLVDKAERVLGNLDKVFGRILTPGRLTLVLGAGLVSWLFLAMCNWAVALGFEGLVMTFPQILVMTAVSIAAVAIPAAPGGWGVFEAGAILAMGAAGVVGDPALLLAYAVVCHLCQYGVAMVVGALSFVAYRFQA